MRAAAPRHSRTNTRTTAPRGVFAWTACLMTLWLALSVDVSSEASTPSTTADVAASIEHAMNSAAAAAGVESDVALDAADVALDAATELSPTSEHRLSAVDDGLARERAERALERTGSKTSFPEDDTARDFTRDGLHVRDRGVPRDLPLDKLSGCAREPKTKPTPGRGCSGCNECEGLPKGPSSQASSSVLQILLGLILISLIAGLLYRVLLNRRRPFEDALSEHELVIEARGMDEDAVEQAAKRGDFNAAIHAVFLRTLLRISERGVSIRRDWTPREIPQRILLEDRERAPLRELVALAELARFSDHRSSAQELEQAQEAASRLVAPISARPE